MSNTLEILAPADQTEGTRSQVLRWLKSVGDSVARHEPLIELETDKVTVEVAAPAAGVLREIVKAEQEEIAPGEVLGRLELEESNSASNAGEQTLIDTPYSKPGDYDRSDVATPASAGGEGAPRLSPAVRRLLNERHLDPSAMTGSGEGGRITVDDVLAYGASQASITSTDSTIAVAPTATPASKVAAAPTAAVAPTTAAPMAATTSSFTARERTSSAEDARSRSRSVPHTAIRKRIASHMVQSLLQTAPHVTTVFEADLTAIQAHRATHRENFDSRGAPLTLTAYFIAATVGAIRAVPEANSRWTDTALEISDDIHIGVATAIEGTGLVVPVLKHVESLDLFGIATHLNRLVTASRAGSLDPADVRGGTFTISNHGVSGSLLATPIVINQPQSAILGIGKLEKRPVVVERDGAEQLEIRSRCYVTLTIDHRVMDGHQANHFLQVFVRTLESWPAR